MIFYRSNSSYAEITARVRSQYDIEVIPDKAKPVDKQVMQAVGYCAQIRVKDACQPVFDSLSSLEKMYGSLNYRSDSPRRTVIRTNMGLLFSER